ncbi:MAG: alpha/beta fold hydrolase [Candidatus Limnocylindrales bacterium]
MTRIATRDGVAYDLHDTGRGPVLVLLHGFAGSSRTWGPLVTGLGDGRRLVAIDLLGHGGSDGPTPERQAVERQGADLAWLIDGQCGGAVDVLGYSLGARVALWLAVTTPQLVARLVLESPSPGIDDASERDARVTADERWAALLDAGDLAAFHAAWEAQPVFASRAGLPDDARTAIRDAHLAASARGLAASLRGAGQGVMPSLHDRLAAVGAPALVIAGDLDPVGRGRAAAVAQRLPDAHLEVVPDAGHAPHLERPDAFLSLVTDFLAHRPAASTGGTP